MLQRANMMNNIDVFVVFLATRLASVFLVQTYFVPDEYWQSSEVAHKFAFGYGHLTWEWILGVRNYLHPLIISVIYKILQLLSLDSATLVVSVRRVSFNANCKMSVDYFRYFYRGYFRRF